MKLFTFQHIIVAVNCNIYILEYATVNTYNILAFYPSAEPNRNTSKTPDFGVKYLQCYHTTKFSFELSYLWLSVWQPATHLPPLNWFAPQLPFVRPSRRSSFPQDYVITVVPLPNIYHDVGAWRIFLPDLGFSLWIWHITTIMTSEEKNMSISTSSMFSMMLVPQYTGSHWSCMVWKKRMSTLKYDSHIVCSTCWDIRCDLEYRSQECRSWSDEQMQEYLRHGKSLESKEKG